MKLPEIRHAITKCVNRVAAWDAPVGGRTGAERGGRVAAGGREGRRRGRERTGGEAVHEHGGARYVGDAVPCTINIMMRESHHQTLLNSESRNSQKPG